MNARSLTLLLVLVVCLAGCASSSQPAADAKSQDAICRSYAQSNNPDVTPPKWVRGDQPTPPKGAQSGYACVRVTITESGSVVDPVVVKTDNQEFAQAFVRALSDWQYTPATRGSAKVVYHTVVLAHFP
ncbi:MAG TPA: energy transducer TonB [Thermoanaerobaculia bacterium]|nr:energy transducer TonB [Thermoanaerobaculia bacterium]